MKLTNHLHLVLSLRMHEATPTYSHSPTHLHSMVHSLAQGQLTITVHYNKYVCTYIYAIYLYLFTVPFFTQI
jgi:hypothetical protein